MDFKKFYINEKYKETIKSDFFGNTEIFDEPLSRKEIQEIFNEYGVVRMVVTDEKKPKFFAWEGNTLHSEVRKKIKFDFGFIYAHKDKIIGHRSDGKRWKNWIDYKHKKEFIKRINFLLPKVKLKKFWPDKDFTKLDKDMDINKDGK